MAETSIINIFLSKTEEERKNLFNKAYAGYICESEKKLKKTGTSDKM